MVKRAPWEAGEHCPYLGHLLQEPGRKMSVGADHEQMPSDNSLTVLGRSYEVLTWAVSLEHRLKGA